MSPAPVIDLWAPIVPSAEITECFARGFPEPMLGYLRVFFKQEPTQETVRRMAGGWSRTTRASSRPSTRPGSASP